MPVPQSINASLEQFMAAVKANDLERLGGLWGTDRGPAAQWMDRQQLRQRLTVIQKYMEHSGYRRSSCIQAATLTPGDVAQRR